MLFERTCRIKQDFDWFLRFVPPNSVEKKKISKNHSENRTKKQTARFFRLPVWGCLSLSDMLSMFLFVMSVNQKCQRCTTSIKMQKSARIIQKPAQKQAARFLSPACFDMFEPSKAFSMFLFMMPANQAASHCNQNQNANDQRHHLPVAFP